MRNIINTFMCLAMLIFCGCATVGQPSSVSGKIGIPTSCSRHETVAFDWGVEKITVSFFRQKTGEPWTVTIRDSWDKLEQSTKMQQKVWGVSEARCSTERCLQIIEQSLIEFMAEKPQAELESIAMEMHVSRELWNELLIGLKRRLATLPGEVPPSRIDVPDEIDEEVGHVLDNSAAILSVKTLLNKHGFSVQAIGMPEHVLFKDSLSGRKWSEIAALPDVGVLIPGAVSFEIRTPIPDH